MFHTTSVKKMSREVMFKMQNPKSELGQYLLDISKIPLLTKEEELKIAKRARNRDIEISRPAQQLLVKHNVRLVVAIARQYQGRGVDLSDLIAEGNLGLIRASEKFKWHRGCRFTTYASYWIKQFMHMVFKNCGSTVRRPAYIWELHHKIKKYVARMGRDCTVDELAQHFDRKPEVIELALSADDQGRSLDVEIETLEGNISHLRDAILDYRCTTAYDPDDIKVAMKHFNRLHPQEKDVISRRYLGEYSKTLKEIGDELGLSRERIRQVEEKALAKLKKAIVEELDHGVLTPV